MANETVLVVVKAASTSRKAAPTSRMRISKALYNEEMALAKQEDRPSCYHLEGDQHCEGNTMEESRAANKDFLAARATRAKETLAAV